MPVVVDPDPLVVEALLASMPAGSHGVESLDRLNAWLHSRPDEYVVVLGPTLSADDALQTCELLRATSPAISTVLAREELEGEVLVAAMKAGARDVGVHTDTVAIDDALSRALSLYVALRGPSGALHLSKVVTVFSPKGGVGKTTVSVNLALALAERGARRVCLVDLDLAFGDVAITMQLFPTHSMEQAIGSEDVLDVELLDALLTRHQDSLMVLAAPPSPDTRERITPALVSRIIRTLRQTFDFVVIDSAPAFDEQVLTALEESDDVVLVTTLDVPTLKNVKVALETLDALNVTRERRHLVLNRADDAVGISSDKVQGILGMRVSAEVGSSLAVAAATNAGSPIIVSDPQHQMSGAVRQLAGFLVGDVASAIGPEPTPAPAEHRSRFSRRRK